MHLGFAKVDDVGGYVEGEGKVGAERDGGGHEPKVRHLPSIIQPINKKYTQIKNKN